MGQLPGLGRAFLGIAFVAAIVGATLSHILPWLWGLVKPLIHAATGG